MKRTFNIMQKFIVYEKNNDKEIPRLFQIIDKENLQYILEVVENKYIFYILPEMQLDKKVYIEDLYKQTYNVLYDEDIFVLESGNDREYSNELQVGYMDYRSDGIKRVLKNLSEIKFHTFNQNSNEMETSENVYFAIEIGKFNSKRLSKEEGEQYYTIDTVSIGEEWRLSEEDIKNMSLYDLYCYAEEMGCIAYYDIYDEKVREFIDERNRNIDEAQGYFCESDGYTYYDTEAEINDIHNMYDDDIDRMCLENFKKCFFDAPILNQKEIPNSYLESYLSDMLMIGEKKLQKLEKLKKDNEVEVIETYIKSKKYDSNFQYILYKLREKYNIDSLKYLY